MVNLIMNFGYSRDAKGQELCLYLTQAVSFLIFISVQRYKKHLFKDVLILLLNGLFINF